MLPQGRRCTAPKEKGGTPVPPLGEAHQEDKQGGEEEEGPDHKNGLKRHAHTPSGVAGADL